MTIYQARALVLHREEYQDQDNTLLGNVSVQVFACPSSSLLFGAWQWEETIQQQDVTLQE